MATKNKNKEKKPKKKVFLIKSKKCLKNDPQNVYIYNRLPPLIYAFSYRLRFTRAIKRS